MSLLMASLISVGQSAHYKFLSKTLFLSFEKGAQMAFVSY